MADELQNLLDFVLMVLRDFGFDEFEADLSTRDPEKSIGSDELWDLAEASLAKALETAELPYQIARRRRLVLRPEDRHPREGCDRSTVAALDDPTRLRPARELRTHATPRRRTSESGR